MNYISLVESKFVYVFYLYVLLKLKLFLLILSLVHVCITITCVCVWMSVWMCVINIYVHVQACWPVLACVYLWRAEDHVRSCCLHVPLYCLRTGLLVNSLFWPDWLTSMPSGSDCLHPSHSAPSSCFRAFCPHDQFSQIGVFMIVQQILKFLSPSPQPKMFSKINPTN